MSILQGIWNMSDNLDSLQIVKKYSNGLRTLNHVNFRSLVHSFNPSISDAEIDTFFKQTTAEYQQPLITTYILHQLIRKQSFAASTKRSPLELKDKLTKLLKGKNLQIQKVLAVFDQERKGKLTESEFQQFIEYYIPNIGPIEYEELRKSLRSQIIDEQSVSSWLENNTSSDQRPAYPVANKLTQEVKQQTPQPQPQQIKPEPVKQPVSETVREKEIEQKVVSKWDKLKSHDPQDVHPHLKEIVDLVAHNVDFAEIVKLDHPLDGIKEFIQTFHQLDTQNKLHEDSKTDTSESTQLLLVGNKSDMTADRQVSISQAQLLAKQIGCTYEETSAKTGENVENIFKTMVTQVYDKIKLEIIDLNDSNTGIKIGSLTSNEKAKQLKVIDKPNNCC